MGTRQTHSRPLLACLDQRGARRATLRGRPGRGTRTGIAQDEERRPLPLAECGQAAGACPPARRAAPGARRRRRPTHKSQAGRTFGPLCVRAQGAKLRNVTPFGNSLVTLLLFAGGTVGSAPGVSPVKVNEIKLGPAGFVELRNTGSTTADIGGWTVGSCTGHGVRILATISPNTVLPPGEYFVIVGSAFSGTVPNDSVVDTVDGTGVIARNRYGAHVDSVGLNMSSPCREAGSATPCIDSSLGRDAASRDTDQNSVDFQCQIPSPSETNM